MTSAELLPSVVIYTSFRFLAFRNLAKRSLDQREKTEPKPRPPLSLSRTRSVLIIAFSFVYPCCIYILVLLVFLGLYNDPDLRYGTSSACLPQTNMPHIRLIEHANPIIPVRQCPPAGGPFDFVTPCGRDLRFTAWVTPHQLVTC
jgi:hypothetical protein